MVQVLVALFLGFFVSMLLGKRYILWLKKHDLIQPIKEAVEQKIYSENESQG